MLLYYHGYLVLSSTLLLIVMHTVEMLYNSSMALSKSEYNRVHQWLLRHYRKAGTCEYCGLSKKTQWSSKTNVYDPLDRDEWQEFCAKCHHKYDYDNFGKGVQGYETVIDSPKDPRTPHKRRGPQPATYLLINGVRY